MVKRRLIGGLILGFALTATVIAQPPTTAVLGTPPQPGWSQLTPKQKTILAPLAADWESMENIRRKKWLKIAERYPGMSADEQDRIQKRMHEWAALTPEQRAKARGTYKDFNQLPSEQKQLVKQKWEAYSNLPSDEKQRVRESGKSTKLLAPTVTPENRPQPADPVIPPENPVETEKNR